MQNGTISGVYSRPVFLEARRIFAEYHATTLVDKGVSGFKLDECDHQPLSVTPWSFPEQSVFPSGLDGEQMHLLLGPLYQRTMAAIYGERNQRTLGLVRASGALAAPLPFSLYSDAYAHRAGANGTGIFATADWSRWEGYSDGAVTRYCHAIAAVSPDSIRTCCLFCADCRRKRACPLFPRQGRCYGRSRFRNACGWLKGTAIWRTRFHLQAALAAFVDESEFTDQSMVVTEESPFSRDHKGDELSHFWLSASQVLEHGHVMLVALGCLVHYRVPNGKCDLQGLDHLFFGCVGLQRFEERFCEV
jgi:hypothetical protein